MSANSPDHIQSGASKSNGFEQEHAKGLTDEQKKTILDDYAAAMRGEVVDARTALYKIRAAHGF